MKVNNVDVCDLCARPLRTKEIIGRDGPFRYQLFGSIYETSATWKNGKAQSTTRKLRAVQFDVCRECFDGNVSGIKHAFELEGDAAKTSEGASDAEERKKYN